VAIEAKKFAESIFEESALVVLIAITAILHSTKTPKKANASIPMTLVKQTIEPTFSHGPH